MDYRSATSPEASMVYRASPAQLLLAGATQNRMAVVIGGLIAVLFYLDEAMGDGQSMIDRLDVIASRVGLGYEVLLPALIAAIVLAGWLVSMATTLMGKYDFTLQRQGDRLRRSFGLLTRHENVFPIQRVQMIRVIAPIIQRRLGYCRVVVDTAGSFAEQEGNSSSDLCPIIRQVHAAELCRLALPGLDMDRIEYLPVSHWAARRAFVRYTLVLTILLTLYAWAVSWWVLSGMPAVLILAFAWSRLYVRALGWKLEGDFLVGRSGVVTRTHKVVRLEKIQAAFVAQSPMQRRLGIASLRVITAGNPMTGNTLRIPDLDLRVAQDLQDELIEGKTLLVE